MSFTSGERTPHTACDDCSIVPKLAGGKTNHVETRTMNAQKVGATDERRNLVTFGTVEEPVRTSQQDTIERTMSE